MPVRRSVGLTLAFLSMILFAPLHAQKPDEHHLVPVSLTPWPGRFHHQKQLQAAYDSVADSTRLSLVTHKGMYFALVQRPKLTWSVAYQGRSPAAPPAEVALEFKTQEPQSPSSNRLLIESGAGSRIEVRSAGANTAPGTNTSTLFCRFSIPTTDMARALASDTVVVSVGGVVQRMKRDQLEALRELLARVGAWSLEPGPPHRGG